MSVSVSSLVWFGLVGSGVCFVLVWCGVWVCAKHGLNSLVLLLQFFGVLLSVLSSAFRFRVGFNVTYIPIASHSLLRWVYEVKLTLVDRPFSGVWMLLRHR